jgi:hypothetical protein
MTTSLSLSLSRSKSPAPKGSALGGGFDIRENQIAFFNRLSGDALRIVALSGDEARSREILPSDKTGNTPDM